MEDMLSSRKIRSPERLLLVGQRHEKTCLRGFRPGPTRTGLYNHRRLPEALNFGFIK